VERRYSSYSVYTSVLDGGEWSASRLGPRFTPGERIPGTHCTGGWVGPRAGLDTEATGKILSPLPGIEPRSPIIQPLARHYTELPSSHILISADTKFRNKKKFRYGIRAYTGRFRLWSHTKFHPVYTCKNGVLHVVRDTITAKL
jgi:hypothetical protein